MQKSLIEFYIFSRAIKSLERMVAIGAEYPLTEPQNQDLQQKLEELRTKFKQVYSMSLVLSNGMHKW